MKRTYITLAALSAAFLTIISCEQEKPVTPDDVIVDASQWDEDISVTIPDDVLEEGYYKDVMMDGGTYLTSRERLPACDSFDISLDFLMGERYPTSHADSIFQIQKFVGSEVDHNGFLMYPDGKPRYKVFYSCGGSSGSHGRCLGAAGRNAVRTFFRNGGSYQGSCAGAFLASVGSSGVVGDPSSTFYAIWPGHTTSSGLNTQTPTGMFIEPGSGLLNYFDFGGDMYVDSVRHHGGCYTVDLIPGTEVLARYDYPAKEMHQKASIWAWKNNRHSGRVICCGSHPEEVDGGERMELMGAMLMYSMDGRGVAEVKQVLHKGEQYIADKESTANDPLHAKIGDGQYHHFAVGIPSTAKNVRFRLEYFGDYEINVLAKRGTFAFENNADSKVVSNDNAKELLLKSVEGGTWFFSVHNNSRPDSVIDEHGNVNYTGKIELLNGIAYKVSVSWE